MRTIVRYTRRPQGIDGQLNHLHDQAGSALSRRDRIVKGKNTRLLNRREFSGLCAALGSFVTSSGAFALDAATGAASTGAGRTVKFRDGTIVPALGQGSAGLGKGRHPVAEEEEALRTGLSLGMTLIDTAEIYGSEEFIGRVIAGQRNRVFLVSKVWPSHVAGNGIARACEASLARLGTDHLDLYLLHWPNGITDFSHVVRAFEDLHAAGKIRAWGVSNFKVGDMEKLFQIRLGDRWAAPEPVCCVIPGLHVLAKRTVVRQPPLRWLGAFAAAMSLRFPSPVRWRM